jgi:hypothetical protein
VEVPLLHVGNLDTESVREPSRLVSLFLGLRELRTKRANFCREVGGAVAFPVKRIMYVADDSRLLLVRRTQVAHVVGLQLRDSTLESGNFALKLIAQRAHAALLTPRLFADGDRHFVHSVFSALAQLHPPSQA